MIQLVPDRKEESLDSYSVRVCTDVSVPVVVSTRSVADVMVRVIRSLTVKIVGCEMFAEITIGYSKSDVIIMTLGISLHTSSVVAAA